MTRISGDFFIFRILSTNLFYLFPFRAVHDGTAGAIVLIVFFHAEGNHLTALADPAVGCLR